MIGGLIGAIIIGIAAGWIAEQVMKRNHGLLTNLGVGLAGGLLGWAIVSVLHIGGGGWIFSLIVSSIGAILLLFLLDVIKRRT